MHIIGQEYQLIRFWATAVTSKVRLQERSTFGFKESVACGVGVSMESLLRVDYSNGIWCDL